MTLPEQSALECHDISVRFGDVVALSDVSVSFERGRIHAVVGQNGAGKTTFARVVAGLLRPGSGRVTIDGDAISSGSVNEARDAGVELVHQSFALPPSFTVAEAMQFGCEEAGLFSRRRLEARWQPHLDALGVRVDAGSRIRDLPVETLQGVEIARALVRDARLLILDEPTAVLSPEGTHKLFDRVRRLKELGVTVVLILHKIREVLDVADTVTVLRGGHLVDGPIDTDKIKSDRIAELIIGQADSSIDINDKAALTGAAVPHAAVHADHREATAPMLELQSLSTVPDGDGPPLDGIDLKITAGEIVGVAGVEGNGQRTLVRALSALASTAQGNITIDGSVMTEAPLAARRAGGLRIIPFERNVEGLSLTSPLWENWSARELLQKPLLASVRPSEFRKRCDVALRAWDVRYAGVGQNAGALSGGNAQKVILSREMDEDAKLIIAAQPTRGLDIGATAFVWDSLRSKRAAGCGILLISSDLDELMDICDRIVVMLSGRLAATFEAPFDIAPIGAAMTGATQ